MAIAMRKKTCRAQKKWHSPKRHALQDSCLRFDRLSAADVWYVVDDCRMACGRIGCQAWINLGRIVPDLSQELVDATGLSVPKILPSVLQAIEEAENLSTSCSGGALSLGGLPLH